jgi:hypothetical protein
VKEKVGIDTLKSIIGWDVTPCSLIHFTGISEEPPSSKLLSVSAFSEEGQELKEPGIFNSNIIEPTDV